MASGHVARPGDLADQTTEGTAIPTQPAAGTASFFNNAQNINFDHSMLVTNIQGSTGPLKALYKRVAPNAILNAGGRADEVRCHPGTREEVIDRIEMWRADAQDGKTDSRMFWLSGPAGAGKTAIVQTVAESWSSRGVHAANFFFFRSDTTRNHARSLVATLLYQIFAVYPAARKAVEKVLTSKPRILDASITQQFDELICSPLRSIGPLFSLPLVLLVDGLDECDPEEKTSQQKILQALDTLVGQNDLPFLVLVASRVEHQIDMAFRELSSAVDSTFLSEQYSPRKDLYLFVTDKFDRIKRTHPLAPSDASWLSDSDVDGIVAKSSGQFIYAATVMGFISESPESPALSLQKVQGAAPITTKSPFSQLDALYTYILAQADDQEALKDILHAEVFVSNLRNTTITFTECLKILNNRYNHTVITSCVAYVAAVARFEYDRLIFYHASLTDYLKDQARSGAYFFDSHAFDLKIVPLLFKHQFEQLAYSRLHRLRTVTLDIMRACNACNAQDNSHISRLGTISKDLLIPLHDLCVRGGAVADYRLFLYKWLTNRAHVKFLQGEETLGGIPYIQRYMTMVQIDQHFGSDDADLVANILRPESASDGHEIALWLQDLFLHMYVEYYDVDLGRYRDRLRRWTSWAVSNNVPVSNMHKVPVKRSYDRDIKLEEIPYGRRYITMALIEHINGDLSQDPDIVLDPLCGEPASGITSWVRSLLLRIKREYYPHRLETYKRLIRQWISWAHSNLSAPEMRFFHCEDIPYCLMYITMPRVDTLCGDILGGFHIEDDVWNMHSVSESGAGDVALWVQNLLRSIYKKFYPDCFLKYKRLIKWWTCWAVKKNIPLFAPQQSPSDNLPSFKLEDVPYVRMYTTMAQIDTLYGDIQQNSDIVVDILRPESASDTNEVAQWVHNLLRCIKAEFYPDRLKYGQLIKEWIMWAVSNNIPLADLDDLPYARRYLIEVMMKKWIAGRVKFLLCE